MRPRAACGRPLRRSLVWPCAALLVACAGVPQQASGPEFEIRRVDVGFPTASVLARDLDGDGADDVIASGGQSLVLLRGARDGHLRVVDEAAVGEHPVDVAVGDLDEDGRPDFVVANHDTDYITLVFGDDDGFATARTVRMQVDVEPHPHAVAAADVDEDGHVDVLVDDRNRERLRVYRGLGDGTFQLGEPIPVGGDPYRGMVLADLDGDGHLDLVTPNPHTVVVQRGDGTGRFTPLAQLDPPGLSPFSVVVGDVNGDGFADIGAGSGEEPGAFAVWLGSADGGFTLDDGSPYSLARGPTRASAGDADDDGTTDFLVTSYVGEELAVLLGGPGRMRLLRIPIAGNPWDVAAGDVDGDGRTDLVTANDGSDEIAVLRRR